MHRFVLAVFVMAAATFSSPALAFEGCDAFQSDRIGYSQELEKTAPLDLPTGYFEQSLKTEFSTRSGFAFFPYAHWTPGGYTVGVPLDFITFLCRATYVGVMSSEALNTGPVWDSEATTAFHEASMNAAECLRETRGKFIACLPRYGEALVAGLRGHHDRLNAEDRAFAAFLFQTALTQIIRREYAHVFLGHLGTRMETAPYPADDVFGADFFALSTNVGDHLPISGQVPYLELLSYISELSGMPVGPDRDNMACRWTNIENFSALLGASFVSLGNFVEGGDPAQTREEREAAMQGVMDALRQEVEFAADAECGGASAMVLGEARSELRRMYAGIYPYADVLFAAPGGMDPDRTKQLIAELAEQVRQNTHLKALPSRQTLVAAIRLFSQGKHTDVLSAVGRFLDDDAVYNHFTLSNHAHLLALRSEVLLQYPGDMDPQQRFEAAWDSLDRSVGYNPFVASSWLTLARMAIMKEKCDEAATYADYAQQTGPDGDTRDLTAWFLQATRALAGDPDKCSLLAGKFREQHGFGDLQ